jgi:hypothetical protein
MKLSALRISIAINVLLLGMLGAVGWRTMSVSDPPWTDADARSRLAATIPEILESATTLKELNAKLLGCGFTVPQAKQLVLASLRAPPAAAFEYWRSALIRQLSDGIAAYELRQAQRRALVEAFGTAAADQPEFAAVFFPFADRWSYLSKSQQSALEVKVADAQRSRLAALRTPGGAPQLSAQMDVEGLLGVDGAREYNNRESVLAQSLSNIGFDFSEQEFRSVFRILAEAGAGQTGAIAARLNPMRMSDEQDPVTARIKEALGEPRFNEYRKSQDPRYRVLLAAGAMYGIAKANVDKAYEIDRENTSKVALLAKQGPVLSADTRRTIEGLRMAQSNQLRELLGEEASAFYTRSTATIGGASASAPLGAPIMVRPRLN